MEDDSIISWIMLVPVAKPIKQRSMNFDIASVGDISDAKESTKKIRPPIGIKRTNLEDAQGATVGRLQGCPPEILLIPNVPKEPLMDIERAHMYGRKEG